jgi:hypothetical protein
MKKLAIICLIVLFLLSCSICFVGCGDGGSELNKAGASIDWGEDYHWDSTTESVRKNAFR